MLTRAGRLSQERLVEEWRTFVNALRPEISERLALVAQGDGYLAVLPEPSPGLTRLAAILVQGERGSTPATPALPTSPKFFVVLKILLSRWLLGDGPLTRAELGDLAGCSYPTVAKSLERLAPYLEPRKDRAAWLKEFPGQAWDELLASSPRRRGTISYVLGAAEAMDAEALLGRLRKLGPLGVAVGGVLAARYWDPAFDLNGLPRIDLSMVSSKLDLSFMRRLDPALEQVSGATTPALVIHPLRRPALQLPGHEVQVEGLPVADPVETLLDLHELRLLPQAEALVEALRRGISA